MLKLKVTTIQLLLLFCSSCYTYGQMSGGLDPLVIGPGTKALALNETVTAELLGASNLYSNPANLALEQRSGFNADYTFWIGNSPHTHAAINTKKESRALAFGFISSQANNIELRSNQAVSSYGSINFISLAGAYANKIGPLAFGGTIQYLREEFYVYNAHGYAANVGVSSHFWNEGLLAGASLLNIGTMHVVGGGTTSIPTLFRLGFDAELITFVPPDNQNLPVTIKLKNDWTVPLSNNEETTLDESAVEPYTNIALEFEVAKVISLYAGYKTGQTVRPWSTGISIDVGAVSANYAMTPFETGFKTVHSLGIGYRF